MNIVDRISQHDHPLVLATQHQSADLAGCQKMVKAPLLMRSQRVLTLQTAGLCMLFSLIHAWRLATTTYLKTAGQWVLMTSGRGVCALGHVAGQWCTG